MTVDRKIVFFECNKNNFYSLASLIATIDQHFEDKALDIKLVDSITIPILRSNLNKYSKIVVASSFRTAQIGDYYKKMTKIYKRLKHEELRRIIFIAGGSHATGDPESTLKIGYDYAFKGEGEYALSLFLTNFLYETELRNTPNIHYLKDGAMISNPLAPLINLDEYPLNSRKRKLFPPLEITRGCVFGCKFCQVPSLFGRKTRHRSPDIIFDTIKWMAENNLYDIRFITPNSFGYMSKHPKQPNIAMIKHLLKTIKKTKGIRNIYFGTFPGEVRPETVSEELLESIKPYIANRKLAIGLQTGSEKVLQKIKRGHTLKEGLDAIEIIRNQGFKPVVDFIFGLPESTIEDEMKSVQVMKKLVKKGDKIRLHTFMPLPGSAYENEKHGVIPKEIRQEIGLLTRHGKIEGSWSHQIHYAKKTWDLIRKIKQSPAVIREDNYL